VDVVADDKNLFGRELVYGLALFGICFLLASLEVQIEGPNGWASKLPTWRLDDPRLTWIFGGRPITGYHFYLNLLLLAFFHFPLLFTRFSWRKEAALLSGFGLIAVFWDFLWFVINPHFGLEKYSAEFIWWFKNWRFGFPVDYFWGLLASLIINQLPGMGNTKIWGSLVLGWAVRFMILVILAGIVVLIY
jgi:hypothetical protein